MSATEVWRPTETRSVIWLLIQAAGDAGIGRTALMEQCVKSATAVDWHLTNMARDGHIQRPEGSRAPRYVVGPKRPPIEGLVLTLAMELLEDCPSGVSEHLLCRTIGCSWRELGEALVPAERAGRVERRVMPAAHGGGVGWCLPGMGEPELPVVEIDIDRIHQTQRPDVFAAHLDDGCLSISSGALTMKLSAAHTEKLMAYLMAQVCR